MLRRLKYRLRQWYIWNFIAVKPSRKEIKRGRDQW